jgi:fructokinase
MVCGESLFDVFSSGATKEGISLDGRMGGSPFNVAIGLARLGQPVSFLGAIGRDFGGERLVRALEEEGVRTGLAVRVDAPTTLMLVGLDGRGVPSYVFYGQNGADRQLREEHLAAGTGGAAAYHFGSYSMVVNPTGSTQRLLVEREHARSVISYDPNVRLRVEPDVETWRSTLRWMMPRTHLLKVSEEDLGILVPGMTIDQWARDALTAGPGLVVVTRGAEGATGYSRQAVVQVPSVPVKVADTVGAGDTFQAALLAWAAEAGRLTADGLFSLGERELRSALGFATRAAAVTCGRRGADMPRRGEL